MCDQVSLLFFDEDRDWIGILEQFKAGNEQAFYLMNKSKPGNAKFDSAYCLVMQQLASDCTEDESVWCFFLSYS